MFDFKKLDVYKRSLNLYFLINRYLLVNKNVDQYVQYQLRRAIISVAINIAEGSGKHTIPDRRKFFVIARGSVYECSSLMDLIGSYEEFVNSEYVLINNELTIVSKMLYMLIKSCKSGNL